MPRIVQRKGNKGSQLWLQDLVNKRPDTLADALRPRFGLSQDTSIKWLSPLESDEFAEYRDDTFLERIGISLQHRPLRSFWPSNGPQWDALGKTSRGDILLVEAKAHIGELKSACGAGPASLETIQRSLRDAGQFFGVASTSTWADTYYQYANRLAHLYLLRQLNHVPAWLIFLYFVNADDVAGPGSAEAWRPAIEIMHAHLSITSAQLDPYVVEVFMDVTELANVKRVHQW